MKEFPTEKCLRSLQLANEAIIKSSQKTILSSSNFKDLQNSMIAEWLQEEEILNMFRYSFQEFNVDDKVQALKEMKEKNKPETILEQKLLERKKYLENEIQRIKEELPILESKVNDYLSTLTVVPFSDGESDILT